MGSSIELFSFYKKYADVFIETGTYKGEGSQRAFDSGYSTVYSCDINSQYVQLAKDKFSDKNFVAINESSEIALRKFLSQIDTRCVIFLDGHAMPYDTNDSNMGFGEDTCGDGSICPLMEELKIISEHHVKDHVILIDDFHCFNTWCFNFITYDDILEYVKTINPSYKHIVRNDVLCFYV